jgi:mono/diheme cytochrome c family protein
MSRNSLAASLFAGVLIASAGSALAAPDWNAVTTTMGRDAVEQPGDIHRYNFPRTDLDVVADGVEIKAGFALGSWLSFAPMGDMAMVMGDLVVLQTEVPALVAALSAGGIDITAIHHHLIRAEPFPLYVHVEAMGDAATLATALRAALDATATPTTPPAAAGDEPALALDTAAIDGIIGFEGTAGGGVYKFSIPRAEAITANGMEIPNALGLGIALNFQPTEEGQAAITGDFVLTADEVNPVIAALTERGIEVTALHNHMLNDEPRLFFMHFWANADALELARGLRAALDLVAIQTAATDATGTRGAPTLLTFTAAQVSQGRGIFGGTCSGCHGENLAGLDGGPPLTGPSFAHWFEGPVADLFTFIHDRMPADRPGTLTERQTAGLVAFLAEGNGLTPGDTPLPEDPAALAAMAFHQ